MTGGPCCLGRRPQRIASRDPTSGPILFAHRGHSGRGVESCSRGAITPFRPPALLRRVCTQSVLTSDHIKSSMPDMQNVIGIRSLRRRVSESMVRVGRGETIVIVRHGRPIAIIRPLRSGEAAHRISVTTFRRNLRRTLAVTRRRAIVLTWYGDGAAVVAPVPPDFELDDDEEEESA